VLKQIIRNGLNLFGLQISRRDRSDSKQSSRHSKVDDYDWDTYSSPYEKQLRDLQRHHTLKLSHEDYCFNDGELRRNAARLPLHPNHRLLYETILILEPLTVAEVGCGGGDHIHNLNILAPHIEVTGLDRAAAQVRMAIERSPTLIGRIQEFDITLPFSAELPRVDLVYTQAVIMHIKAGNGHLVALSNLFKMASKYVVLMENWTQHEFLEDIRFLITHKMLPWREVHFYLRRAPEMQNQPHLMVASSIRLPMEPLENYTLE